MLLCRTAVWFMFFYFFVNLPASPCGCPDGFNECCPQSMFLKEVKSLSCRTWMNQEEYMGIWERAGSLQRDSVMYVGTRRETIWNVHTSEQTAFDFLSLSYASTVLGLKSYYIFTECGLLSSGWWHWRVTQVDTNVLRGHMAYLIYPEGEGSMPLQNIGRHISGILLPVVESLWFVLGTYNVTFDECVKPTNFMHMVFFLVKIQF